MTNYNHEVDFDFILCTSLSGEIKTYTNCDDEHSRSFHGTVWDHAHI